MGVCVIFGMQVAHTIPLTGTDLKEQVFPKYCISVHARSATTHIHTDAHSSMIHAIRRMFSLNPGRHREGGGPRRSFSGRPSV